MTCHDAREQFSAWVDEALGAEARAGLEAHLAGCADPAGGASRALAPAPPRPAAGAPPDAAPGRGGRGPPGGGRGRLPRRADTRPPAGGKPEGVLSGGGPRAPVLGAERPAGHRDGAGARAGPRAAEGGGEGEAGGRPAGGEGCQGRRIEDGCISGRDQGCRAPGGEGAARRRRRACRGARVRPGRAPGGPAGRPRGEGAGKRRTAGAERPPLRRARAGHRGRLRPPGGPRPGGHAARAQRPRRAARGPGACPPPGPDPAGRGAGRDRDPARGLRRVHGGARPPRPVDAGAGGVRVPDGRPDRRPPDRLKSPPPHPSPAGNFPGPARSNRADGRHPQAREGPSMTIRLLALTLSALLATAPSAAAAPLPITRDVQRDVQVTIYNGNLGLVKDVREVRLPVGTGEVHFMDVAAQIDPTTVHLRSLSDPAGLRILEQNYEYDLLSSQKLMEKYVGKRVRLYTGDGTYHEATLLTTQGPVFEINGLIHLGHYGRLVLPSLPENLVSKPTLAWLLRNHSAGPQRVEASYLTGGITWKADYVMVLGATDDRADLTGWVTIDNKSRATYAEAALKLVAGDVHRAPDRRRDARLLEVASKAAATPEASREFAAEGFFEYHLYTLDGRTTIKDNQTKQLALLSAADVPIQKHLIYYGAADYYRRCRSPTRRSASTWRSRTVGNSASAFRSRRGRSASTRPTGRAASSSSARTGSTTPRRTSA
ncbi:MAG: zf-HC2 domain-containing protein [Candidatus Rokubacteria bacterium]|nr:zf-HC2 domain-containing protein [Candidatus Rokubacteria bacterium]